MLFFAAEDVLKQIDLLQLMLIDFGEDKNLTRNKLKITHDRRDRRRSRSRSHDRDHSSRDKQSQDDNNLVQSM